MGKAEDIARGYRLPDGKLKPTDVLVDFSTASLTSSLTQRSLSEIAAAPPVHVGPGDKIVLRLAGLYKWHADYVREHSRWPTYTEFAEACDKQALTKAYGGWSLSDTLWHSARRSNGPSLVWARGGYKLDGWGQVTSKAASTLQRFDAMSHPDAPLTRFRAETARLPQNTEAERLVVKRIGQDIFRDAQMDYWGGRCPLTGIAEPELLRASHIVPWAECRDEQRLDVNNGLLLSALWDAAFDKGLVSFTDNGVPLLSPRLTQIARTTLGADGTPQITGLCPQHRANLALHRARHGFSR